MYTVNDHVKLLLEMLKYIIITTKRHLLFYFDTSVIYSLRNVTVLHSFNKGFKLLIVLKVKSAKGSHFRSEHMKSSS